MIPTEAAGGERVYLCAFVAGEAKTWIALDALGRAGPRPSRAARRRLDRVHVRGRRGDGRRRQPPGAAGAARDAPRDGGPGRASSDAEQAVAELEQTVGGELRVASPAYLDEIGAATRRLELALGESGRIPLLGGDEGRGSNHRRPGRRYRGALQARTRLAPIHALHQVPTRRPLAALPVAATPADRRRLAGDDRHRRRARARARDRGREAVPHPHVVDGADSPLRGAGTRLSRQVVRPRARGEGRLRLSQPRARRRRRLRGTAEARRRSARRAARS